VDCGHAGPLEPWGHELAKRKKKARLSRKGKVIAALLPLVLLLGLLEGIAWVIDGWTRFRAKLLTSLETAGKMNAPLTARAETTLEAPKLFIRGQDGEPGKPYRVPGGPVIVEKVLNPEIPIISPEDLEGVKARKIFVVGGSAAFGFIYNHKDIHSTKLEVLLRPRGYRVYNAAIPGWASGQVVPVAHRIVDHYKPHALLIFCGNNEWIHWSAFTESRIGHRRLRIYRLAAKSYFLAGLLYRSLKGSMERTRELKRGTGLYVPARELIGYKDALAQPLERFMTFDAREWAYSKQRYLDTFEANLRAMIRRARQRGVRVVLLTMPFNFRLSPSYVHPQPESFVPEHAAAVRRAIREAARLVDRGRYDEALRRARAALKLDPSPPILHYLSGVCLERLKRPREAERAYARSRENTIGGLGSRLSINERIVKVARETGADLVDVQRIFEAHGHTKGRYFNQDLIHDECHATPLGNTLIANAVAKLFLQGDATPAGPAGTAASAASSGSPPPGQ
jgi:tetratricopeptide (TPR) repeat protein